MKKYVFFLVLLCLRFYSSYGQTYREVKVGDKVPDVTIQHFFNDEKKAVKISELYKHRLLILDFWGTWCSACLDEMQTFPALKAKFGDQINIVAVGYEPKEKIAALFKRNPALNGKQWSTLYGDSLLTRVLFPHHTLPHLVWIDSTGKVITMTEGYHLTPEHINEALSGEKVSSKVKIDNPNFSPSIMYKPFRQMDTNFFARSILTKGMTGGGIGFASFQPYSSDKHPLFNRIYNANIGLWQLYWQAVFPLDANDLNEDRLIFEVSDTLRFIAPSHSDEAIKHSKYKTYDNWVDSNAYCYELILPKKSPDSVLRAIMLSDLNRYLNLNGRWEWREMNCYAIKDNDGNSKDSIVVPDSSKEIYYNKRVEPITYAELLKLINKRISEKYVFNESSISNDHIFNISSEILVNISPAGISSFLSHMGLRLVTVKRKVPVYVVSD